MKKDLVTVHILQNSRGELKPQIQCDQETNSFFWNFLSSALLKVLASCWDSFVLGSGWLLTETRAAYSSFTPRNPCMSFTLTQRTVCTLATNFCLNSNVSMRPNTNQPYLWVKLTPSHRTKSIMKSINQWCTFFFSFSFYSCTCGIGKFPG